MSKSESNKTENKQAPTEHVSVECGLPDQLVDKFLRQDKCPHANIFSIYGKTIPHCTDCGKEFRKMTSNPSSNKR